MICVRGNAIHGETHITVTPALEFFQTFYFVMAGLKASLSQQLENCIICLSPEGLVDTISTLRKIFDNIIQHPNDEKYRQIRLANKTFSSKVWRYPACEKLMKMSGWVVEDDHVRLRDYSHVHIVSQLLESFCRQRQPLFSTSPSTFDTQSHKITDSSNEVFVPPAKVCEEIVLTMTQGYGNKLRNILNQYDISAVKRMHLFGESSIIMSAYLARQIGMVRILAEEYGIDVNTLDTVGCPCFYAIFTGCNSSDTCQSQIIDFIKELKLNVQVYSNEGLSAIHYAVLHKLFTVLRFLVEKCEVDINQPLQSVCNSFQPTGGTALHIAYSLNETDIALYLIEHGADTNTKDSDMKKPKECMSPFTFPNYYSYLSEKCIKERVLYFNKEAAAQYNELMQNGMSKYEAIDAISKTFADEVTHSQSLDLQTVPTMNQLNHYITEMAPSYYTIGLELGIPYSELKVIKSDPSLVDLKEKCLKMLEVWLARDTSATWKKLCDALEDPEVSMCALAERIKKTA